MSDWLDSIVSDVSIVVLSGSGMGSPWMALHVPLGQAITDVAQKDMDRIEMTFAKPIAYLLINLPLSNII
jgi:hypothetical protein